jgi:branched-chain amino acid transport system permease protein
MLQFAANGVILGATLALGAIGLTLAFKIMRFANFAHGAFLTFGAYFAFLFGSFFIGSKTIGPFGFGWPFLPVILIAAIMTAGLALLIDLLLWRPLRKSNVTVTLVIASFGASLVLQNVVTLLWGPQPEYFTHNISIAEEILPGIRLTGDEIFVIALTIVLMIALHLFLTRTKMGKAMRAVSDNPALSRVTGINVQRVIYWTWIVGGGLAAVAGIFYGLTVQLRPLMGFHLILPMFAAAILGGIGSIYGAALGGLIIGLAEALSVPVIGAGYKPAIAFLFLLLILLVYPKGILGERA